MNQTRVSVIICAYTMERLKDIHEAVDSVLAQTLKPHEVIVAVDHNQELLHSLKSELPPDVKVVLNDSPHGGSSATDNVGVSIATGDIVAFMDDDAVAERDWIEQLVKPYQEPSILAVGGKIVPVWQNERPKWFCEELNWIVGSTYKGHPEDRTEVRNLIFCNASLRRQVFDSLGLFPADTGRSVNWGTGFESQFFLRMKSRMPEAVVLYEPSAIVYHKVTSQRAKMKYLILRCYNEGFHKAKVKRACAGLSQRPLSTESSYLRYLLLSAIPHRLMHFYKPRALAEAGAIGVS
ncbi:MAG: glycosyltransferase family 2 protein, partial [Dehalococcoidia bacterium]